MFSTSKGYSMSLTTFILRQPTRCLEHFPFTEYGIFLLKFQPRQLESRSYYLGLTYLCEIPSKTSL